MGRKKRWPERTAVKFAAGTFERIAAVLADGEERMAFMRKAIEREIQRRERNVREGGAGVQLKRSGGRR
jgi:hypothetical protein